MKDSRISGVLPVDKPEGPTSHDVVAAARRALRTRRIGHTGTLDPFASGLLLLCIGPATRLAEYLVGLPKTYRAVAHLGAATDTADRTGERVSESPEWRSLEREEIEAAFGSQVGSILQVPPAYSAKKVAGERAYDRARRGEDVELEPVPVTIYRLDILDVRLPEVEFEVECSSGTYIRAIARDVGERLGVGGYLESLRRTRVGAFDVSSAVSLDELEDPARVRDSIHPMLEAVSHLPRIDVGPDAALALSQGRAVAAQRPEPPGQVAVAFDGRLLAIAESDGRTIRPRKVFSSE